MALNMRPSPKQIEELLRCADIGADQLADLAVHIDGLQHPPLLADKLLDEVESQLSPEEAKLLLGHLLSLSMIVRRSESKPIDVIKAVRDAIQDEKDAEKWDSIATQFQSLIESSPVRLVTKAMELTYDYAMLLRGVRILTDLRPLFDEKGTTVEGGVVTHTLRVEYQSDDGSRELSLALDLQDIAKLREQCDRAVTKAESIRDEFANSTSKPCLISGEAEVQSDD